MTCLLFIWVDGLSSRTFHLFSAQKAELQPLEMCTGFMFSLFTSLDFVTFPKLLSSQNVYDFWVFKKQFPAELKFKNIFIWLIWIFLFF